ncbi:NAD(P)-dependent dehydrogenase (short-subunit alcohol dehydrogenase family) [Catenulispora sp. GAS73]|uniref:oxidoreductase n=1 Tax=Catenulispora sp. GAS73 TaxID=3156269 RepID=UPI00351374BD
MPHRTFLITGASSGLGRATARHALDAGHIVIGTVRTEQARKEFEKLAPGRAHARILDLSSTDDAAAVITEAQASVGPVDVLIAAAGYGHEGTVEESTLPEWRRQFDVNVFGTVAVIQAVLPTMRERRSGHIITITSVGALIPSPTLAAYASSKSALESITRALAAEVAHLGIHVTAVEPGAFRTDWSGRSLHRTTRTIPDYDQLVDPISTARADFNGHQPGDPTRAATALLRLTELPEPPSHLVLGSDAYRAVTENLAAFAADVERWRELSVTTDFVARPENTDGVPSALA